MAHQPSILRPHEQMATWSTSARRDALVLGAIFAWFAVTAWMRPLSLPDEGRYAGVAYEMLRSGNWLVPTLDTLPYFHKPPLFYWLTAGALAIFGVNEWAARLPSLLAAAGAAFAVYLFLRRWVSEAAARVALLVLATTPYFYGGAQFANMDMLVAACITLTILCLAEAVLAAEYGRPYTTALTGAYAFAGLGILAKGLIGAVIPGIVVVAWLIYLRRPAQVLRLVSLPGIFLFALIVVPWFALMELRHPGFLNYFFIHHHFERFAAGGFNNPRPFWLYVPLFALVTLPWFPLLWPALRRQDRDSGPGLRQDLVSLALIWLVATIVFFSIPSSKLIGYVLPAVPPFAVLIAHAFARDHFLAAHRHFSPTRMAAGAGAFCVVLVIGYAFSERDNIKYLAAQIAPQVNPQDDIVLLRAYPFSLPFYLGHQRPLRIEEDWDADWLQRKDTWRRELYEAAKFSPERGKFVMLRLTEVRAALCSDRTVWIVGADAERANHPELNMLETVARKGRFVAWRSARSGRLCSPATPGKS